VRDEAPAALAGDLLAYLQTQHPVVVITLDPDGTPCAEMVSWVVAPDVGTIRLAIGSQRRTVRNVRERGAIALQILGAGLACEVKGRARVVKERCESVRFPQTLVEVRVESVRDNMYPANFVTGDVPVGWPGSTEGHHQGWNAAIEAELRCNLD
jgi:flavin reductase (DIM6/NTAB) family NADH-FMN oxidoreductase RutF